MITIFADDDPVYLYKSIAHAISRALRMPALNRVVVVDIELVVVVVRLACRAIV